MKEGTKMKNLDDIKSEIKSSDRFIIDILNEEGAELKEKRWPDMFAKIYNDIETLGKLLIDNKKMYELVVR